VPAIVVCDVNLPGMDGLSLLSHAKSVDNDVAVILITERGCRHVDEMESMPPAMQVKLLRVLQERKIERLGSNDPVTVRVIAACKPNLIGLVEKGQFRQDLFYRLNVAVIDLPPLRERKEDIPLLFEHFVLDAARRHQRPAPVVTERQLSGFLTHERGDRIRGALARRSNRAARGN